MGESTNACATLRFWSLGVAPANGAGGRLGALVDRAWGVEPPSCSPARAARFPRLIPRTGASHQGGELPSDREVALPLGARPLSVCPPPPCGPGCAVAASRPWAGPRPAIPAPLAGVGRGGRCAEPPPSMFKARYHRSVGLRPPALRMSSSTSLRNAAALRVSRREPSNPSPRTQRAAEHA